MRRCGRWFHYTSEWRGVVKSAWETVVDRRDERLETLEMCGLTYHYPRSKGGIEGVNLRLVRGWFVAIAGGREAGKSTLLRAVLGALPGVDGQVRWNGRLVTSALISGPVTSAQGTGSAMADGACLAPPRCAYLAQAQPEDAQAALEGMARLLESQAELLLVDDLSAVLSVQEECALWDALFARRLFRRQGACLAVSNRQPALSRADQIVVLAEGRVVGTGQLGDLLRTCAEMRRIWRTNLEGSDVLGATLGAGEGKEGKSTEQVHGDGPMRLSTIGG
jgi:ATP-binding cassette subfamily B protein